MQNVGSGTKPPTTKRPRRTLDMAGLAEVEGPKNPTSEKVEFLLRGPMIIRSKESLLPQE